MRPFRTAAFTIAATTLLVIVTGCATRSAAIDSVFAPQITPRSPGCGLALIRGGAIVEFRGYGLADVEKQTPWTAESVFHPGSIFKQFHAAALLTLVRQGRLSLDDDVRKYLPEIPDYGGRITVREALTHTHGLREFPGLRELTPANAPSGAAANLRLVVRQREPNAPAGTRFVYGNTGPLLATAIMERLSGVPPGELVWKSVLQPAGMVHTALGRGAPNIVELIPGYVRQADGSFQAVTADSTFHTTLTDLAKWSGYFDKGDAASREILRQLMTPATLRDGTVLQSGMSMSVKPYRGLRRVWAPGAAPGFRAAFMRFPDTGLTIALGCNHELLDPIRTAEAVADVVLADEIRQAGEQAPARVSAAKLPDIGGTYVSPTGWVVRVQQRDKRASLASESGEFEMDFVGDGRFVFRDKPFILRDAAIEARFEPEAQPRTLELRTVWEPFRFVAVQPVDPGAVRREDYIGTYASDEVESELEVFVRNDALFVKAPRGEYALEPLSVDLFRGSPQPLTIRFARKGGRVVSAEVSRAQVRVVFTRRLQPEAAGLFHGREESTVRP